MSGSEKFFREYHVPEDAVWADLDDVPEELRRLAKIYATALNEDDDREVTFGSIDDFYEVYDQLQGGRCFVAGIAEEDGDRITTVAKLDIRDGQPFGEGVATTHSARGLGMGQYAIHQLLETVRAEGHDRLTFRAQQRVVELYRRMGAQLLESPDARWPLMAFDVDKKAA